jgi:hypothetical protein
VIRWENAADTEGYNQDEERTQHNTSRKSTCGVHSSNKHMSTKSW